MSTLSQAQRRVYAMHGEAIAKYDLPIRLVERVAGCSFRTARAVKAYVKEHGPPTPTAAASPSQDILVIGDAHAKSGVTHERFAWLGRMIQDRLDIASSLGRQLTVVCIGDWADMPALSSYDRGKRSFEGRRYVQDVTAARKAQEVMFRQLTQEQRKSIRWVYTEGNHEDRIRRAANDSPELTGLIDLEDLGFEENGWEVYPFKTPAEVQGIAFAHYFPSGVMGRAISGVNVGRSIVLKTLTSAVQGHSHLLNHYTLTNALGRRLHGLSCGCYFEHHEDYAGPANQMYWRGICVLSNAADGDFDLETVGMETIKRLYR